MSLDPLLNAPVHIQIHAIAAMAAFVLGVVQIAGPKGTLPHRIIGAHWVTIMVAVVISSAFITNHVGPSDPIFGRFGFIHLFTVLGTYAIIRGLLFLHDGGTALKRHAGPFVGFFVGGILIAGGLAFAPGRTMHVVIFGASQ